MVHKILTELGKMTTLFVILLFSSYAMYKTWYWLYIVILTIVCELLKVVISLLLNRLHKNDDANTN